MNILRLSRSILLAAGALAGTASAQSKSQPSLEVRARAEKTIAGTPGNSVTIPSVVTNLSQRPVTAHPVLRAPTGWTLLLGQEKLSLDPRASETWIVSVGIPFRVAAGKYLIEMGVSSSEDATEASLDSITVEIAEHHAVGISLVKKPGYAISGDSYEASYQLTNLGNAKATISVGARSQLARKISIEPAVSVLDAGQSRYLTVTVKTRKPEMTTHEDVLELRAVQLGDTTHAAVSASITIVDPPEDGTPRTIVPATLKLRASPDGAIVAPFEFSGSGRLRSSGDQQLSFLARGKPGKNSTFGERDEYRIALTSSKYSFRAGDNLDILSPLLGAAEPGFGASGELRAGWLSSAAYVQRFRLEEGKPIEAGVSAGWRGGDHNSSRISVNAINRLAGQYAGRRASIAGRYTTSAETSLDFEVARNISGRSAGARSMHIAGRSPFQFDIGYTSGDSLFNGASRGNSNLYGVMSGNPIGRFRFNASASRHRALISGTASDAHEESFTSGVATVSWAGLVSLDYSAISQRTGGRSETSLDSERALALRLNRTFSLGSAWISAESGNGRKSPATRIGYGLFSAGATVNIGSATFSLFGDRYSGSSISRGIAPYVNIGGDASVKLGPATSISVSGFSARTRAETPTGYVQLDTRITRVFPGGTSFSLRGRRSQQGAASRALTRGFAEFSVPFGLPTFRVGDLGRATGHVVDAETGAGVPGALVRLGPTAAITDSKGNVYFRALPAGEYRASLAQDAKRMDHVFVGDPNVRIDSVSTTASRFNLAIARAATIEGSISEWVIARTHVDAAADSLVESAPLEGVLVGIVTPTDTLYRTTDASGRFVFSDLYRGSWTVQVLGEAPAGKTFSPASTVIDLKAGESAKISFKLVPRKKTIRILDGGSQ